MNGLLTFCRFPEPTSKRSPLVTSPVHFKVCSRVLARSEYEYFELIFYMIYQVVLFKGQKVCFIFYIIVTVWFVCFNVLASRVHFMYLISFTSMSYSDSDSSCSCCCCCCCCCCLCVLLLLMFPWPLPPHCLEEWWALLLGYLVVVVVVINTIVFVYVHHHHQVQQCVMCVCSAAMTTRVSEARNHQQPNSQPSLWTLLYYQIKTWPKAQLTRGLSLYHKFLHKTWSNFNFRIS